VQFVMLAFPWPVMALAAALVLWLVMARAATPVLVVSWIAKVSAKSVIPVAVLAMDLPIIIVRRVNLA